jgi:prolyl 4-hydroxylase
LVYLNDDYEGGETDFPELGLRIRGAAGTGLLFANAMADGRPDPRMRHAGLPVQRGSKLVASRWIRARAPQQPEGFGPHEVERQ